MRLTGQVMETTVPAGRIWWRFLLGSAWLAVPIWLWVTRAPVLLAGHPALGATAAGAVLIGLILLVFAFISLGRRRIGLSSKRRALWLVVLGRGLTLLITLAVLGSLVYLRPFSASDEAIAMMDGASGIVITDSATRITLAPPETDVSTGLVFQPGARVDPRAYVPMLEQLATDGSLVVIVKQPFGIGFTALDAPGGIIADHPEITHWVVGGHSLGGVAASSYAGDHPDEVAGLLLWASYPLDSLVDSALRVTSVSGTEDGLATPADIEESRTDLPGDTTFVAVEGAVHAFFGDYGAQPGDGTPGTDRVSAQAQIVAASTALLAEGAR